MHKTKILIFIDWFLPGTKSGGPVRSVANLIAHLGDEFKFYVITRDTDFCSAVPYVDVNSNTWNTINNNTQVYYISREKLNINTIKTEVSNLAPDIIYVNGMYSWYFSILPVILFKKKFSLIVSSRGMLSPQAFSVKGFKKNIFLKVATLFGLYKDTIFHATNRQEQTYIEDIIGKQSKVMVAPNLPRPLIKDFNEKQYGEVITFVNVARVSAEKGTLKMIKAFTKVVSEVVLDIYGPIYDSNYWQHCQEAISLLPANVKVKYKGSVSSEDIPNILERYNFFILLSEGENFGHAIFEGLSTGCPVIISDKTPWQDLESKGVGWDLDIDNSKNVTAVINRATRLTDQMYSEMSRSAFEYAMKFANDPKLIEQNKELFNLI